MHGDPTKTEIRWRSSLTISSVWKNKYIFIASVITNVIAIGCPLHYKDVYFSEVALETFIFIFLGFISMIIINLFTWNLKLINLFTWNLKLDNGVDISFRGIKPVYYFIIFNGLNLTLPSRLPSGLNHWTLATCVITFIIMFSGAWVYIVGIIFKAAIKKLAREYF